MARILFGNTVSRVMLNPPVYKHSVGLAASAQRKLWLAQPGDAVVTAQPVPSAFRDYVAGITRTPATSVRLLSPACACTTPLPEANGIAMLLASYHAESSVHLCPYAFDEAVLQLATDLHLPVEGYGSDLPSVGQVGEFAEWNRKSTFRRLAEEFGFPIAPGCYCANLAEVAEAVLRLKPNHWPLLIKLDRSSNGFGSLLVNDTEFSISKLETHFEHFRVKAEGYVVEALMDFQQTPSVEAFVDETGVCQAYICDQICNGPSFRGMVTPAPHLSASATRTLILASEVFGAFLKGAGYHGYFDLDAGITRSGDVIFTEANVRRTAGTTLHELVSRMAGADYQQDRIWLADTQPAACLMEFAAAVAAVHAEGIAYSSEQRHGVLFPAFTLTQDSKWRYLIVGQNWSQIQDYEDRLASLLGFARPKHADIREPESVLG